MLYAAGAIMIKVALSRGANSWAVAFITNVGMMVIYIPMLFFGHEVWHFSAASSAVIAGALFFVGQVGTFRSLATGDVSIATPALASKLVFVALMSLALPGSRSGMSLWIAVFLTMVGVMLLHAGPRRSSSRPMATAGWAIFAAVCFSATDVITQAGAPRVGFTLFLPVMFGTVAVASFPLLLPHALRRKRPLQAGAWTWGSIGVIILIAQSAGVAIAIALFGDATGVNVVYSSRGLWSLIILAFVARQIGVAEGTLDRRIFALRVLGSILILIAVVMALR